MPLGGLVALDLSGSITESAYSYGSYTGSYDIFGNILDDYGFQGASGGTYTVSPNAVAAEQSAFILSQSLPAAIGDINSGRVSPIDTVTVYEREGPNLFLGVTTGNAANTLSQWSGIVGFITSQAGTAGGDLTTPVGMYVPGGAGLEMDLQQLYNYLQRSQSSLYPGDIDTNINSYANNELWRPADGTNISDWYGALYNTGSDISLRQTFAYSQEAQDRLNLSFQNALNRPIDGGNLGAGQEGLFTGYFTQASFLGYLATTPEAINDLSVSFQNTLNRPIDSGDLSAGEQGLATQYFTQQSWLSYLAYTAEAAAKLSDAFQSILNRPIDAGNLAGGQAGLADGYFTQATWRTYLAQTPEAAADVNQALLDIVLHPDDSAGQAYFENELASGESMNEVRQEIAISGQAETIDSNLVQLVLDRPATTSDINTLTAIEAGGGAYQDVFDSLVATTSFDDETANFILVNSGSIGQPSSPGFLAYEGGTASSSNAGALTIPSDPASHTTATQLLDSAGHPVLDATGSVAQLPVALSPEFFVQRGHTDGPLYASAIQGWDAANFLSTAPADPETMAAQGIASLTAKAAVEASLIASPIVNFGQGRVWDAQRYDGTHFASFVSGASILIGIYGAAAGIPESMMQGIQNDYAFLHSRFAPGTVMDSTYRYLPATNVENVHIGYELVTSGQLH